MRKAAFLLSMVLLLTLLLPAFAADVTPDEVHDALFAEQADPNTVFDYVFGSGVFITPTPKPTEEPTATPRPTGTPIPVAASGEGESADALRSAKGGYPLIMDDSLGLLTAEEQEQLRKEMEPLTAYCAVAFRTTEDPQNTEREAMEYFSKYINRSRSYNGVLVMIDMNPRMIYVFSRGVMERIITRSDAYAITSDISHLASDEQYYACAAEAFRRITAELENRQPLSPTRILCTLAASIVLGVMVAYSSIRQGNIQPQVRLEDRTSRRNISVRGKEGRIGTPKTISVRVRSKGGDSSSCGSSCSGSSCSSGGSSCSSCSSCGSGGGSSF